MSYARITTIQVQAGKIDEAVKLYRELAIPAAKQQKGYLGTRLFVDRATDKGMAVTRWASEADLKASEENGYYQDQLAKFGPLLAGAPVREVFEIEAEDN